MKIDFHVHSKYSPDARGEIAEIIRMARSRGLGGIAIVDHNEVKGSLEGRRIARETGGFVVVRGCEVSSGEGHILAYGVDEAIPRGLPPDETVERIRARGGIAVAAHPYRFWSGIGEVPVRKVPFDAVEVHNARSIRGHNLRAGTLAVDVRLPPTAGSDAHTPWEVGAATATLPEEGMAEAEILEAVVKARAEVGGDSRRLGRTMTYTTKCVSQWMLRGMRRI